jgi:hypothetical protein
MYLRPAPSYQITLRWDRFSKHCTPRQRHCSLSSLSLFDPHRHFDSLSYRSEIERLTPTQLDLRTLEREVPSVLSNYRALTSAKIICFHSTIKTPFVGVSSNIPVSATGKLNCKGSNTNDRHFVSTQQQRFAPSDETAASRSSVRSVGGSLPPVT